MPAAACTIVDKRQLAHARVTARSFARHHPGIPFFTGLADRVDGAFDAAAEPFATLELDALGLPAEAAMPFRLAADELAYATTPFLIERLLDRGFDRVLFFKRESLVTGSHAPSLALLDDAAIVLTPHLLEPLAAGESERELDVLLAGTYNVGFLGIAESPAARAMLRWWQERLREHCRHDVMGGLHFEQRWVDLVPGMFDGVRVTRDPGASIGHWSLPERRVAVDGEDVRVDGRPCRLVRFSGYDLDHPEAATRYHDRLAVADAGGDAAVLFRRYRELVLAAGDAEARALPYAFAAFDNGVPVPAVARALHTALGPRAAAFGDPFATAGPGSFWSWLTGADEELGGVSRLWASVVRSRPDVHAAYRGADGLDLRGLGGWAENTGRAEHAIPDGFPLAAA
jgi:hypothetical protein